MALTTVARARQLGQAVVPAVIEAMVGRQVDDHAVGPLRRDRGHDRRGLAIGQGQHDRIGTPRADFLVRQVLVAQLAAVLGHLAAHRRAGKLARGNEGQLEPGMADHEPDQLGTDMATCAHDAECFPVAHCHVSSPARAGHQKYQSSRVGARAPLSATQRSIAAKSSSPHQNTRQRGRRRQPSLWSW